ncbi:SgcJ/EcaC family oxidoreductase [Fibrisoma montanum]|uniref:SgcJ/EcaC family oxidoreductase n=1 Tax=Fibrisoma montanum TaxID=2305895 RepID=A0A418M6L3_9BACT|nr:SgcJ/EcaC family oxidoreductase [Fibrisoma montanum]RIV21579.1 SgcJ/EcaC family oxidoreductase [Fibrisoma montanum]
MTINSTLPEDQTQAVTALLERFVDTWNAKDPALFGTVFTDDAEFIDVVGQVATNRSEIIEQHRYPFAVVNKQAVLSLTNLYIRSLTEGLVIVTGEWQVENSSTPAGQLIPLRNGVIQLICRHTGPDWAVRLVHNTDLTQVYRDVKPGPGFSGPQT